MYFIEIVFITLNQPTFHYCDRPIKDNVLEITVFLIFILFNQLSKTNTFSSHYLLKMNHVMNHDTSKHFCRNT